MNCLVLDGSHGQLIRADVLSEFDAIRYVPSWPSVDGRLALEAVNNHGVTHDAPMFHAAEYQLAKRQDELRSLLLAGGVLVVEGLPPSGLILKLTGYTNDGYVDTWRWWCDLLPRDFPLNFGDTGGGQTQVKVPSTHPFYDYLAAEPRYGWRFVKDVAKVSALTVLATDRDGAPVAIEVRVGKGAIVVVPPHTNAEALKELDRAIELLVDRYKAEGEPWVVEGIKRARAAIDELELKHQKDKLALEKELQAAEAKQTKVLGETDVKQLIKDFEDAKVATTPTGIGSHCYKVLDFLQGNFGDRKTIAAKLGVPFKDIDWLGKTANDESLGIRHKKGLSTTPTAADLDRMLEVTRALVQAYIEHRAQTIT